MTKLIENYRSHGTLLQLYSDQFYNGELVERADHRITHSLCNWEHLPTRGVPLLFHGIQVLSFHVPFLPIMSYLHPLSLPFSFHTSLLPYLTSSSPPPTPPFFPHIHPPPLPHLLLTALILTTGCREARTWQSFMV